MAVHCIGTLMLCLFILVNGIPRPNEGTGKNRVHEQQPLSHEEHYKGDQHEHNADFDHEAFLGNEQKATFEQLSPEESLRRLGILVDKIDRNSDGKITEEELKFYIDHTQKRYIYEDVDRQWKELNLDNKPSILWGEYVNRTYGFDIDDPARNTEFNYKDMKRRDRRRWEAADLDKDDRLTKDELTSFLHPEEVEHMKSIMVEETMEDIDKDKDGKISLDEYIGDMYSEEERKNNAEEPDWLKTEKEQFSRYRDKNGDGFMGKVKGKLIQLQKSLNTKFKELKGKIEATNANLSGKIANVEAADIDLQRKIDAGDAVQLKKNLSFAIPNFNELVEVAKKHPECIQYQWLTDSDRHYAEYNTADTKCDSYLNGWYRFGGGAGTKMYTSCRSQYYCSANRPGYLNGNHPGPNDGIVSRTVCFRYSSSCCYYTKSIKVINCGGLYYVYELNGVPSCNGRYCSTY